MIPFKLLSFVLASLLVAQSTAMVVEDASKLPSFKFDYIIVGAGTAGLVLANRLTEDGKSNVLVLEAGGSDAGILAMQSPFLASTLTPFTNYDWNYTVSAQAGLNNRVFPYPRGRVLGGSSSVNYLFHQFGTNEDWNRMASVSSDSGWSWPNMKKYVQKHERFVPSFDGKTRTGQYIPSLHGTNGTTTVTLPEFNQTLDARILGVTRELAEFPYNEDTSGGDHSMLGIGFTQTSANNGSRSSSSTSYLRDANSRRNLVVLINATVLKLIQTSQPNSDIKAFRTVQFTNGLGDILQVRAAKEVILSAGSVGTTQILKLSGIGSVEELTKHQIPITLINPDVGENLSDHTLLPLIFNVRGNASFDSLLRDPKQVEQALNQYKYTRRGVFANNVANNFAFLRLPSSAPIFKTTPDPAPGPQSPHWEFINSNFFLAPGQPTPGVGSHMTVVVILLTPTSRGSITLRSARPGQFDKPIINPKYLSTEFDIVTMREAVRAVKRYVAAPAFADYVTGFADSNLARAVDDAMIDEYVRNHTSTIFHPTGTASMSSPHSWNGVVNPDLRVKGTEGLRIVDASVFPFIPSCHTQGPVYLLANRASDIIKAYARSAT